MTEAVPTTPSTASPLVERKQQRARRRIIQAAEELFAARSFDAVSVTDIAARAEVGRTTFFRHFGDKMEVVFAKERAMLDSIAAMSSADAGDPPRTTRQAVERLRVIVIRVCEQAVEDPADYARHTALVARHPELQARDAAKTQSLAITLADLLRSQGTALATASLAAQLALACYRTARQVTDAPEDLVQQTHAAFDALLDLDRG